MKTKLLFVSLLMLATGGSLFAQGGPLTPAASSSGSITGNSSSCFAGVCVVLHMATSNVGFSVTVSGTWTGTLTVEQSGDNQATWTSVTTTTANTLFTSALTPGITDVRVRGSAAMTGAAVITITASGPATVVNSTGSSSSASPQAPAMAFYLSNACATGTLGTNGQCFNTFADTQEADDCAWTAATPATVTCSTPHFVTADVGKQVAGWKTCAAFQGNAVMGVGAITASGAPLITSFISSTSVQITTAANAVVVSGTFPQGGCFVWGHPDDVAAAAMESAYLLAPQCPKVFMAASYYMFTQIHFTAQPASCTHQPATIGNSSPNPNTVNFSDVYYPAGIEFEGRGAGNTIWYIMPNFPNGGSCNKGPGAPATSLACFVIPVGGRWKDFQITGGSNANPAWFVNQTVLVYVGGVASIDNFTCTNLGAFSTNTSIGFQLDWQDQLYQFNQGGCGSKGIQTVTGHGSVTGFKVSIENSWLIDAEINTSGDTANYSFICYDCYFWNSEATTSVFAPSVIFNHGGSILLYHSKLASSGLNGTVSSWSNPVTGYSSDTAGSLLIAHDTIFQFNTGTAAGNGSISCTVGACTNILENTTLTSQTNGSDYTDVASSVLKDLGGNTATPRFTVTGSITGDASITGTTITSAKLVLSAGWGTTAAWTALTGQTRLVQGTITASGTGQAANPTIVYTFPTPFWSTSNLICSATQVGGTQAAVANPFVPSAVTATGVTFTYQGTPVAANTFVVQISCGVK